MHALVRLAYFGNEVYLFSTLEYLFLFLPCICLWLMCDGFGWMLLHSSLLGGPSKQSLYPGYTLSFGDSMCREGFQSESDQPPDEGPGCGMLGVLLVSVVSRNPGRRGPGGSRKRNG